MDEPTVGQIYRVVKRPATKGDFYWYDGNWARSSYTHSGASPILEPIDPTLVTIRDKRYKYKKEGDYGHTVWDCDRRQTAARFNDNVYPDGEAYRLAVAEVDRLNALDRAAKEKSNAE